MRGSVARPLTACGSTRSDVGQVLGAMRGSVPKAAAPDPAVSEAARGGDVQRRLSAGSVTLEVFGREWRRLSRPAVGGPAMPDELRLREARKLLADFSTLWRNPAVPDRLREDALHEVFARFDVRGPDLIAAHPQPNENAWLLGYAATRQERGVGMVGARGFEPPTSSSRTMRATKLRHAPTENARLQSRRMIPQSVGVPLVRHAPREPRCPPRRVRCTGRSRRPT